MSKNRTELETQVDTDIVATLAIADHRTFLKDELIDSAVLRKDVIASETPGGGTVSINFANKDLATVTTTANLAVSFTGMENGDVKYLAITKNAGNTISFTGATDTSIRRTYINATALTVIYQVFYKNGVVSVQSINVQNDLDIQTNWVNASINGAFGATVTQTIKYRLNKNGSLEITGAWTGGTPGTRLFTLDAGYRPAYTKYIPFGTYGTYSGGGSQLLASELTIASNGYVTPFRHPDLTSYNPATLDIIMHID